MNLYLAVTLVTIVTLLYPASSNYILQIRMVRYNNPTGEDYDGGPCDLLKGNLCEYFFMFCIRDINATSACWHMAQSLPSVEANSYIFNQTGPLYTGANINNPISFTSNQAWPGSFQLSVVSEDFDDNENDLLDHNLYNLTMSPSDQFSAELTQFGIFNRTELTVQVRVFCQPNYYSSNCTVYCAPQNDSTNGFYVCDTNGNIVCRTGYTNSSGNCLTPICSSGCSTQNGYCNVPNQCLCNTGWTGSNCNECIPKSGCSHGHCTQPNECICETGYGGLLCTEITNCSLIPCPSTTPTSNIGLTVGVAIGGGAGCVLILAVVIVFFLVLFCCCKRNRSSSEVTKTTNNRSNGDDVNGKIVIDFSYNPNYGNSNLIYERVPDYSYNPSYGTNGSPSNGTNASYGTNANPSYGTNGSPSYGTNGSPSYGTNANPSYGTNGSPSYGTNGSPSYGTNGSPSNGTNANPSYGTNGSPSYGMNTKNSNLDPYYI